MKSNRILKVLLVCLLSLSIVGCKKSDDTIKFTEGTYVSEVDGRNGPMEIETVFSETEIIAVTVLSHSETEGIADGAIDNVPSDIVKYQSLKIDVVSGATITSDAIIDGVADCAKQAGADENALRNKDYDKSTANETIDLTTDIIVIGGGAAGMTAAIRADELGYNVILVEKQSYLGGAISVSGGNQVVMGSDLQIANGITNDSVESMVEDFKVNGANLNVDELITLYAENIGETTNWLNEYVGVEYQEGLHQLAEYSNDRELAYVGGGAGFAETYRKMIETTNIEVYLNTQATQLVVNENNEVIGVVAENSNGTTYNITGSAVLLATGGYGNNKDLLTGELANALYYGPASSTGDGLIMATSEGIDADTLLMEYGKRYPNGVEVSEGIAKSTIGGNLVVWPMSAILINTDGVRVVNEKASNRTILEVLLQQEDQMLYLLMDEANFTVWKEKMTNYGMSAEEIDGYLASNGEETPYFLHADTVEELAALANIDEAVLQATIDKYNAAVKAGEDTEFNRPKDYLTLEITEGPYYLIEQKARFATTMGGLVINDSLEVINTSGNVITGLYAAGEVVGGVMGDDSPSGANNGWALTAGKLAAESIAEFIGK